MPRPTASISAIAARLRTLGLQTDAVVGIQLPNTVESVLTILGVLRAGMIAAPLPLFWRRADCAARSAGSAPKPSSPRSRIGDFDACAMAMQVAADLFPIRHVCGFGRNLPDGVIALDGLLHDAAPEPPPAIERDGNPAAHVALVTFDVTPDGLIAVARNHAELIAGGLAALLEGGIEPDARLLGCCATGSFAGLALDHDALAAQRRHAVCCITASTPDAFAAQCRERSLRYRGRAGRAGAATGGGRPAGSCRIEERARGLARAGALPRQPGLAAPTRRR